MTERERDILQLTVRLFVEASRRWGLSFEETADIFDNYSIDDRICDCYEFFHMQGDNTTLNEIEEYLAHKGYVA